MFDSSTVRTIRAVRSDQPSASITDYRRKHSRDRKLSFSTCLCHVGGSTSSRLCVCAHRSVLVLDIFDVRFDFEFFQLEF